MSVLLNQIKKILTCKNRYLLARTDTYLQEQTLTCKNRYLLARTDFMEFRNIGHKIFVQNEIDSAAVNIQFCICLRTLLKML